MQMKKKVLSAIRNSNADNEKSTSAIRNAIKKHDTLYSGGRDVWVCYRGETDVDTVRRDVLKWEEKWAREKK